MRKLSLFVCSSLVLLGMFGLGASAALAADVNPDCTAQQVKGMNGFHVVTDPTAPNEITNLYAGAAFCGSRDELFKEPVSAKQFYVLWAGGMDTGEGGGQLRCANPRYPNNGHKQYCSGDDLGYPLTGDGTGPFTGRGPIRAWECPLNVCGIVDTMDFWVNVNRADKSNHQNERCDDPYVIQCFQGSDSIGLGMGDITVKPCWVIPSGQCRTAKEGVANLDPNGVRYIMTVYQPEAFTSLVSIYYLTLGEPKYQHPGTDPDPQDLQVCARANPDPTARTCGLDDADWVQKNGPAGAYKCTATKPEGFAARAVVSGIPKVGEFKTDDCYPVTW